MAVGVNDGRGPEEGCRHVHSTSGLQLGVSAYRSLMFLGASAAVREPTQRRIKLRQPSPLLEVHLPSSPAHTFHRCQSILWRNGMCSLLTAGF